MLCRLLVSLVWLSSFAIAASRLIAQDEVPGMALVFEDKFESGQERWETTDDASWKLQEEQGNHTLALTQRVSKYQPKVRSPHNIALIRDLTAGDFALTFKVRSTKDTGDHRDCCVFFGHQDAEHFYYVHLGAKPDPASGQIMIVNGEPRRPLTKNEKLIPWDDKWHTVKVVRDTTAGTIDVYFDDMSKAHMSATDKTFGAGRMGIGSFDDMNEFDDVRLFVKKETPAPSKEKEKAAAKKTPDRPEPTVSDYVYGKDSERQRFDFWQAKSDKPTPVVLLIHGGGWVNGDKTTYGNRPIQQYLDAGVSVAAINYRYIAQAMEQKIEPPVKGCLHDAARALQTIRSKAKEWNIDPTRIGASGGSAGACTSLWLALHDDLADPQSADPIARESTRLQCIAVTGAQTSLDPVQLRKWISNAVYAGHAFGFAAKGRSRPQEFELLLQNRDQVKHWFGEYSPIELVTPGDPPLYLEYPNQKSPPVLGGAEADPTHSAVYGVQLLEKCKEVGVSCELVYPGFTNSQFKSMPDFLIHHLKAEK